MNEIQIFTSEQFGEVRTITDEEGNPWFVAKDVCGILGLANVSKAILELDQDDKRDVTGSKVGNKVSKLRTINEPGLYHLIFKSRKQEAMAFKRWVTHDVLPAIRKDGGYIMAKPEETDEEILAKAVVILQKTLDRKNADIETLGDALKLALPAIGFRDYATNDRKEWTIMDAKNEFNMSLKKFTNYLHDFNFIYPRVMFNGKKRWWPEIQYFDCGYCKLISEGMNYAFTKKGLKWLAILINSGSESAMAAYEKNKELSLFEY